VYSEDVRPRGQDVERTTRLVDGASITISSGADLSPPPTSFGVRSFPEPIGAHEVKARPRGYFAELIVLAEGVLREDPTASVSGVETLDIHGGRLDLGTFNCVDPETDSPIALHYGVWEGANGCIATHVYNEGYSDLVRRFELSEIDDSPLGVVLTGPGEWIEPASQVQLIDDVGIVHVQPLTEKVRRGIPPWRGTAVRGGELFRSEPPTSGAPYEPFLSLVTDTCLVTISDLAFSMNEVPETVTEMEASYRKAG